MSSKIECRVCYCTYNAGRRCPRELQCKHSFCETCLLALSRPVTADGADRVIACPLCRRTTCISNKRRIRGELRVDECAMERLLVAGVLEQEEEDDLEEDQEEIARQEEMTRMRLERRQEFARMQEEARWTDAEGVPRWSTYAWRPEATDLVPECDTRHGGIRGRWKRACRKLREFTHSAFPVEETTYMIMLNPFWF